MRRLSTRADRLAMVTGRRGRVRPRMANPQPTLPRTGQTVRPGRITLSVSEYHAMLDAATPRRRAELLGHSPGKAAQLAGISPQAIHQAINRGTLEAFEVRHDDTGDLAWILVTDTSLRDYIQRNRHRSLRTTG